jgi:hypothetical protein
MANFHTRDDDCGFLLSKISRVVAQHSLHLYSENKNKKKKE